MANEAAAPPPLDAAAWLARVRGAEGRGELIAAYDFAQQALDLFPDDLALKHRAVLALAKAGATRRAGDELRRLGLVGREEAEIAALEARIAKDEALAAPAATKRELLMRAADLYERVWRRGGDYYPAINVATLRLLAGDAAAAEVAAQAVLVLCGGAAPDDYYAGVSRAEALAVLGRGDEALAALAAAASATSDLAARATTRRQMRLVCAARGLDEGLLAPLAPPTVIHFTGHRVAAPDATGRLVAAALPAVAREIADLLQRHDVGFGYGALAAGADILFAEALLARGAELHVVLPFDADEFKAISVAPSGADWVARFDACLARATAITYATEDRHLGHDHLFAYGSAVAMGLAVLRARFLDGAVRQMAVWDGGPPGGLAGTALDVAAWRASGRQTDVIDTGPGGVAGAVAPAVEATSSREPRAMLFGDVKGFSRLREHEIPGFVDHVLGALGRVLDGYGDKVLYANTWGDGIFVVLPDASTAARCAIDLQAALAALDLPALGLPDTLALRLGGHHGPVFEVTDPVQRVRNYFGAHVSRTARIEPITPPGEFYVTEPFAAQLALDTTGFACDYVGQVAAAKGYGTMRMYHLHNLG